MPDAREAATIRLENLRAGSSYYSGNLDALRAALTEGGLTLADVGTSEEELERLRVLGCRTVATIRLENLRAGSSDYAYNLDALRAALTEGALTLADVGTSEEELERLRPSQT